MIVKQSQPPQHKNAVVLISDQGYLPWTLALACQIEQLEKDREFDICICSRGDLSSEFDYAAHGLRYCQIDLDAQVSSFPKGRLPVETFTKQFLPVVFAEEYLKILYLDGDIAMRHAGLNELFNTDMAGCALGAVLDCSTWDATDKKNNSNYFSTLGVSPDTYFNAGVLLMDCGLWTERGIPERFGQEAVRVGGLFETMDQAAINATIGTNYFELPAKWNFQLLKESYPLMAEVDPVLVHFVARSKPWARYSLDSYASFKADYQRFVTETLGRNWQEVEVPGKEPRLYLFGWQVPGLRGRNPFALKQLIDLQKRRKATRRARQRMGLEGISR